MDPKFGKPLELVRVPRVIFLNEQDGPTGRTGDRPLSLLLRSTILTCVCTLWHPGSLDAIRIRQAKERIQPCETRR
jgi:hypothetical protein